MKALFRGDQEGCGKQAETLNWQICDDDNEWRASQPAPAVVTSTVTGLQHLRPRRRWWLLLVGVVRHDKVRMTTTALSHNQSTSNFIPAIYGISMRELEAGWKDFLMERYGLAP